MLQKMKRIQVVGLKDDFSHVVDVLYQEGTIHLDNVSRCIPSEEICLYCAGNEKVTAVAEVLETIEVIFATLPTIPDDQQAQEHFYAELHKKNHDEIISRANQVIAELESTTKTLAARKSELTFQITTLNRYARVIDIIQPMEKEMPVLEGFEVTILLIRKEYANVLDLIRNELVTITCNKFELSSISVDEETLATIMVFPKKYSDAVHSFIYSVNVNEVRLPPEYMGRPFYDMIALIEETKNNALAERAEIDKHLSELSTAWYQELSVLKKILSDIKEELNAFSNFGQTEYTFVIMGWIPKKFVKRIRNSLNAAFGDRVVLRELPVTEEDMEQAPTFYDNPRWVKPFEFVMQLVSPPKYREVDPSPILALFFPLFFGIMVGDIGYGIVILLFALVMKRMFPAMEWLKSMMNILIISSIPTIIFGFIFGEFFGNFGEMMGWIHPITLFGISWNRVEAMIPMLILAISIGVIHVFVGLIVGIINAITRKSKKHVSEKAGMLMAISSLIIIMGIFVKLIPQDAFYPTIVLMLIAIPLILYGAGAFGALEIMSTVGNILSYARLMAIGMASVILAMVANQLGGALDVVVIGAIVAIMLHMLNIVLAMFSPSIHAIRLHLVEFFSKFYKGEGIVYKPFKKERKPGIGTPPA